MTDYKKRIDGLIELWCRQEFENERPYGRVTRNIVTPEFVNKLNDLLHQVEAETKFNLLDMLITSKVHLSPVKMMELKAEFEAALHREES